jgi:hypothetical protein
LIQRKKGESAYAAAGVYLLLLQIPGSMAYNVFHPLLFRGVLNLLKSWQAQSGTISSSSLGCGSWRLKADRCFFFRRSKDTQGEEGKGEGWLTAKGKASPAQRRF